jgi:D-lactate dehydrogenase
MSKVLVYSARNYERPQLTEGARSRGFEISFVDSPLNAATAHAARGFDAVSIFVNDRADSEVLKILKEHGVKALALRSAGFNHLDVKTMKELGLQAARVPAYSPYAVAEHTVALLLTLNRKIHKAYNRVREGNFSLEGLLGFDLHGKTVGVVGTGKIGQVLCKILTGFGCRVLAYDPYPNVTLGLNYVDRETLLRESDIVTLHCPLTPETRHFVNAASIAQMKDGVVLLNSSRGALVHTSDLIAGLKSRKIGGVAIDVYEEEEGLFFADHSQDILTDDVFARLLSFPNVLVTGHQAFFTKEAVGNICETTLDNLVELLAGRDGKNAL